MHRHLIPPPLPPPHEIPQNDRKGIALKSINLQERGKETGTDEKALVKQNPECSGEGGTSQSTSQPRSPRAETEKWYPETRTGEN